MLTQSLTPREINHNTLLEAKGRKKKQMHMLTFRGLGSPAPPARGLRGCSHRRSPRWFLRCPLGVLPSHRNTSLSLTSEDHFIIFLGLNSYNSLCPSQELFTDSCAQPDNGFHADIGAAPCRGGRQHISDTAQAMLLLNGATEASSTRAGCPGAMRGAAAVREAR